MNQIKPTYSVGCCPVGEQLGHSTRVTTFQEDHPLAGCGFCLGCKQTYPHISNHPAVAATLRTLVRIAIDNSCSEAPCCSDIWRARNHQQACYAQRLNKTGMWANITVYPDKLNPLDTYVVPGNIDPALSLSPAIDQRLTSTIRELSKIGFAIRHSFSTNGAQSHNEVDLIRTRQADRNEDTDNPTAIVVALRI